MTPEKSSLQIRNLRAKPSTLQGPQSPRIHGMVSMWLTAGLLFCVFSSTARSQSPRDRFTNRVGRTSFPFEFSSGAVILPISIDGSRPLRLVLDSGSAKTLIDRKVAAELGLKEGEESSLQGAGAGRIPIRALPDVEIQMPGLDSKGYDCFTVDLSPVSQAAGTPEDGILGYDFFARFVVTIDFEARRMTVELPTAFHPAGDFEALPIAIKNRWPFVKGELVMPGSVTIQDTFLIDLGSSDAVDHPIVKNMKEKTASKSGVGFGDPLDGAVAVATSFKIGNVTVSGPVVACCGATEATSRLIGTEVLKRFTVVLDYPSLHVFLRPNTSINKPFERLP
ncbi:MAG TPA: retropepsin-like aspartic protease [Edaphobacter sp.]|nr:retropepsin-like aspartic protease [Edaphobacter sp.]